MRHYTDQEIESQLDDIMALTRNEKARENARQLLDAILSRKPIDEIVGHDE